MQYKIFILSGPVRSGKTTRLREWVEKKDHVKGILTPVIENKRMFYDIQNGGYFPMEASPGENDVLTIGKFIFSANSFLKAENILDKAIEDSEWIVIDEIGPLELKGEGFSNILKKILNIQKRKFNLVLIIRDAILSKALLNFGINEYVLLDLFFV